MSDDKTVMGEQVESADEPVEEGVAVGNGNAEAAAQEEDAATEPTLEEQLEAAQAEVADYKDRWLRSQAEFANARKRMDRERMLSYQNATADLAAKILPILDDFERAIDNVPEPIGEDDWFEGIELVYRKMLGILEGFGVEPIEAVGEPFDPNLHEAINQEPSDEYESGVVIRELQKGYQLGDRVIRPSLVSVAQ